jgi:hypothetical protein
MANGPEGSLPGFEYSIDRRTGMSCLICKASDRAMLFGRSDLLINQPFGICEPCTLAAHWAWRQRSGEIPPGFPEEDLKKVSTVFTLIARRREVPRLDAASGDDEQIVRAPAELNSSWEFLLVDKGDGIFGPPSVSSDSQPDLRDLSQAALAALSGVGLVSWPALAEPLFTGYTPRGRLVSAVLIRGWADHLASTDHPARSWKAWPLSVHTGPMAGFWRALETVWSLRLHKHCVVEDSGEMCVQMRDVACRYIELQAALRTGKTSDASMSAIYRSSMNVDELAAWRLIELAEERVKGARSLAVIPREMEIRRAPSAPTLRKGSSIAPWDDPADATGQDDPDDETVPDDPTDDGETGDGTDDSGDPDRVQDGDDPGSPEQEDPTFVRPRRPLKR